MLQSCTIMTNDPYRTVRIKSGSARVLSNLSARTMVPQCDLLETLVDACGGAELVGQIVTAWRLSASRPFDTAAETALATARLAAIGRAPRLRRTNRRP